MFKKIPQDTIIRLSLYLRTLLYFQKKTEIVSSRDIAEFLKISPHQLRKDLSYFGHFGKKRIGYNCSKLIEVIKEILGLNKSWVACIIGFGNLGKALSFYKGFKEQNIFIKFAFDIDNKKINKKYPNLKVYPLDKIRKIIKKHKIKIAILTLPKEEAQSIAEICCSAGIKAILNFAPVKLSLPKEVILKDVDLSCQLAYLTYHLQSENKLL